MASIAAQVIQPRLAMTVKGTRWASVEVLLQSRRERIWTAASVPTERSARFAIPVSTEPRTLNPALLTLTQTTLQAIECIELSSISSLLGNLQTDV